MATQAQARKTSKAPNLQARLKPYDPSKGHVRRGITIMVLGGLIFDEGVVVDGITEQDAEHLRTIRMRDNDPKSPLAFDVLPANEMRSLLAQEARGKIGLTDEVIHAVRENFGEGDRRALSRAADATPLAPTKSAHVMRRAATGNPVLDGETDSESPAPPQKKPRRKLAA